MKTLSIEKYTWTEDDFEIMGWHDATLYAIAFSPDKDEFVLDIDYIFKWVSPKKNESYFKFWVSPATLIFENIHNFSLNVGEQYRAIQIQSIERKNPKPPPNLDYVSKNIEWDWVIDLEVGEVIFSSIGFQQFIRRNPVFTKTQSLSMDERGGISFLRGKALDK